MKKVIEAYKNINTKAFNLGSNYGFKTANSLKNFNNYAEKYFNVVADICGLLYLVIVIRYYLFTPRNPIINIFGSIGLFWLSYVMIINLIEHIKNIFTRE